MAISQILEKHIKQGGSQKTNRGDFSQEESPPLLLKKTTSSAGGTKKL